MTEKLTKRQQAVLDSIERCIKEKGYGPTVRELCACAVYSGAMMTCKNTRRTKNRRANAMKMTTMTNARFEPRDT